MNVFDLIAITNKIAELNERCHRAIMRNREPDEDDDEESMKLVNSVLENIEEKHREGVKYELFTIRDEYKARELIIRLIPLFR